MALAELRRRFRRRGHADGQTISRDRIVEALLERHGRTYSAELGINLERNTPSALYRWLCGATLLSARIGADIAIQAARALAQQGWTSAQKMADATWAQRTRTLNQAGYARYDESTSRMLGDTAEMLLEKYQGDLRKLREAAKRDAKRERALLKECKGIADVGADIFCREAQLAWEELFPFADRRALEAATRLGLEGDAGKLAKRVSRKDYPRLLAALLRTRLAKDFDEVLEARVAESLIRSKRRDRDMEGVMRLTSKALQGGRIPERYSKDGQNVSPPLAWSDLPADTKELALVFENITPQTKEPFVQWLVYKIPPDQGGLPEGYKHKRDPKEPVDLLHGRNSLGNIGYDGPLGTLGRTIRYRLRLLALDQPLELSPGLDKDAFLATASGHVLKQSDLIVTYERGP